MATQLEPSKGTRATRVVIATSVMLSFISFWRAAAIVLNDLGSSAYYVGGIAEQAIGPAAPWFVLGVMLFSYAVRAVYIESCAMFTRGGVYRVVKEALGGTLARLSVSALMFDYILTGPISGVSAGQYIIGLIAEVLTFLGLPWHPSTDTINLLAAGIALLIIWCGITILTQPDKQKLPPAPVPQNLAFNRDAVGWLPAIAPHALQVLPAEAPAAQSNAPAPTQPEAHYGLPVQPGILLGLIGLLIAFGHSVLAMSGEESLAQINRELEYPKHKNLMRAGMVIFIYSLAFTSFVSFFAYAIIPDQVRPQYFNNLISGIALYLAGPLPLKLLFQGFIVFVGFLMLAGAINTSIIGANGVLNRVSEDGVLTDWFRAPHRHFGTTYRIINLIVILQIIAIIASRGNTYTLGEAYAFGVIWSFSFNSLAMFVLRFKDKSPREWKVPFNLRLGNMEIPLGLGAVGLLLFSIAGINLITKQVATVSGIAFTLVFFTIFLVSERINERRRGQAAHVSVDQFNLQTQEMVSNETLAVRPGNTLCLVRDYHTLQHVRKALDLTRTDKKDLILMTVRVMSGPGVGYENIAEDQLFTNYEQLLFSRVVALAEKAGKHVELLVVPSSGVFQAIAHTAAHLLSAEIIAGRSSVMTAEEQARLLGQAWETLPDPPKQQVTFRVVEPDGKSSKFYIGAHAPRLSEEEVNLIHDLWLDVTNEPGLQDFHHKDVVTYALKRLEQELQGSARPLLLEQMRHPTKRSQEYQPSQNE